MRGTPVPPSAGTGVHLSALIAALACTLAARGASAYELRQTSAGAFARWESDRVPFVVDASLEAAAPQGVASGMRAIAAWSRAGGGPELVAQMGTGATGPAADGVNTVLYMRDGYPPAGAALAVTICTVDVSTGEIFDTDIVVNGRYAFAVLAQDARAHDGATVVATDGRASGQEASGPFDLQHVLAHEVGHALGLADVYNDPHAVMYAYTTVGDASNRAPSPDDSAGLHTLYAGASARGACAVPSVVGGREAGGDAPVLTVAILLISIGRRRARGERAKGRKRARPSQRAGGRSGRSPAAIAPP